MVNRNTDYGSGVEASSPDTPGSLKKYRPPEIRRYGRVSHAIFGGSGGKPEGLKKASPKRLRP
jgi:hypothetical protein